MADAGRASFSAVRRALDFSLVETTREKTDYREKLTGGFLLPLLQQGFGLRPFFAHSFTVSASP